MQKITPFLWFDQNAEEAVKFYVSVFKNSRIKKATRYDEASARASGRPAGSLMTIEFELNGQKFTALNGGPVFEFTEAISFVVNCKTQKEIDYYWDKLTEGGREVQCGWLKDRYGLSWQIVPEALGKILNNKNPEKSKRVMNALLKMVKLDIEGLKKAAGDKA
jgi:predicted 3-demethylubiquinone-9 3-methyltransferase (glyoxalase superfamily)